MEGAEWVSRGIAASTYASVSSTARCPCCSRTDETPLLVILARAMIRLRLFHAQMALLGAP
jgi:hypothetical protein